MFLFFFFNDTATTEIYTLSLHDALPIWMLLLGEFGTLRLAEVMEYAIGYAEHGYPLVPQISATIRGVEDVFREEDRKSTRLNSSHANISYAVFCLKKKKKIHILKENH